MPDIGIGDQISTAWWPAAKEQEESTDQVITSATYIPGTPVCDLTFIASRTGRIGVCVAGNWIQASAQNRVFISYEVYLGTSAAGTLVRSARDSFGVSDNGSTAGSLEQGHGNMTMVEGLTEGATYFARVVHRTEAGTTSTVTHRRIIVFPLP